MQNVLGESGSRGFDGYKNGDGALGGGGVSGSEGFGPGGWDGTGLGGYYYDWYTNTYRETNSGNQAVSWNQVYNSVAQFGDAYSTSSTLDMGMHEQVYSNAYRPNPNGTIHLYVSYLDFVAVGAFTGGQRNWLDKTQILMESYGLVNSSKEELFQLAAKSSPYINDLKYFKGIKAVSKGLVYGSVAVTGYQTFNDINNGNYYSAVTRATVLGIGMYAATIPVAGWAVAGGIGLADAIWGDRFYNWVELNLRK